MILIGARNLGSSSSSKRNIHPCVVDDFVVVVVVVVAAHVVRSSIEVVICPNYSPSHRPRVTVWRSIAVLVSCFLKISGSD